ncbi:hypothetical protein CVT24_013292 [Panaeolus cyanescens]|uniref:Ubiquitin-like protease family profile domain-containing protein n=1 Tax=Panaeolus cyanescens TaxID=181874 RepID=A0A409WR87_9AGAR|nr:hypothetical protein CVT24_013292 [Panaeolus cyanescens]
MDSEQSSSSLLAIPTNVIKILIPDPNLSITRFLEFKIPPPCKNPGHVAITYPAQQYLSTEPPNVTSAHKLQQHAVPPISTIIHIQQLLKHPAPLDAHIQSICPPYSQESYLPLWVISYWIELITIREAQSKWNNAQIRVEQYELSLLTSTFQDQSEAALVLDRPEALQPCDVISAFARLPWNGTSPPSDAKKLHIQSTEGLHVYLFQDAWLSDDHICQTLALLDTDMHRMDTETAKHCVIHNDPFLFALMQTAFNDQNEYYQNSPRSNYRWLWAFGNKLASTSTHYQLAFVFNINGNHWVAVVVDFRRAEIHFGNSFHPNQVFEDAGYIKVLIWWASQHSTKKFALLPLPITQQTDSSSCGLLACNALAAFISEGLHPLLDMQNVFSERLRIFLRLSEPYQGEMGEVGCQLIQSNDHILDCDENVSITQSALEIDDTLPSDMCESEAGFSDHSMPPPTSDSGFSRWSPSGSDEEDNEEDDLAASDIQATGKESLESTSAMPKSKIKLDLRAPPDENHGILKYVKRSTKAEMLAQVSEWSEEHAQRQGIIEYQERVAKLMKTEKRREANRLHQRNSRARRRQSEIDRGERLADGTKRAKKEADIETWKDDLEVVTPEDTRPAKKIKLDIKEKNRKPQGRKKNETTTVRSATYHNWLNAITWPLIKAAGREAGPTMSRTAIARILKSRHRGIFQNIHPNTIDTWIDRKSGPRPRWSEKVLQRVKDGFNPIYNPLGRRDVLYKYPEVTKKIKNQLTVLRDLGAPITLTTARGIIIAHIQTFTPHLFQEVYSDGLTFTASEVWVRKWLHREMEWSKRQATQAAGKLPDDWEEQCTRSFFRKAYSIKEHDIPPELFINSDQTQLVYAPGSKLTWAETGAKQVQVVGVDEKRAITVMVSVACDGTALPLQAIYTGKTEKSLPSPHSPFYDDAIAAGFQFIPSGTGTYWSTVETMQKFVEGVLVPYAKATKARLGLPDHQKLLWNIDVYSVHRSDEFRAYMRVTHQNIIVDFVPGGATSVFQPCDVGMQRPFKHSAKRSYHEDIVQSFMEQISKSEERHKEKWGKKAYQKPIEYSQLVMDKRVGRLRDASVRWLWNAYNVINDRALVKKAFENSAVRGWNLSYESLTGFEAREHLRNLRHTDPEFWAELTQEKNVDVVAVKGGNSTPIVEDVENEDEEAIEDTEDSHVPLSAVIQQAQTGPTSTPSLQISVALNPELSEAEKGFNVVEEGNAHFSQVSRLPNLKFDDYDAFWRHFGSIHPK